MHYKTLTTDELREAIVRMLSMGLERQEVAKRLGFNNMPLFYYYAKKTGIKMAIYAHPKVGGVPVHSIYSLLNWQGDGTVKRVAATLGVSPQAISMGVKRYEQWLFLRKREGIE
ncbi:hypothetical protein UFOVP380_5 [uncultured Caudovirales phage]|uniref:Homeodomain-like domain containing protein n=1 Tax=uncultured Caudovirales phage TaxID=2100421 RepID=A0A6J7WZB7_9CAUD|nr:hypothetical protein UFOVP380_5 [uncultured Caudovirales phage]